MAQLRKRIENNLRGRIEDRLAELGRSAIEAATKGGLERNYIRDLIAGKKSSVSQKNLPKVAKGLDWTMTELIAEGRPDSVSVVPDITTILEYDVRGGASYAGGVVGEEEVTVDDGGNAITTAAVRSRWGFPVPFLRDELRMRAGRAHILAIRGDSMVDTLYDGDRAIIDLDDTDVSQGGVFALVDDDGTVIVKQVELVRGGGSASRHILCTSRNSRYKPFELMLESPVRIIGRVASKITRI